MFKPSIKVFEFALLFDGISFFREFNKFIKDILANRRLTCFSLLFDEGWLKFSFCTISEFK